MINLGKKSFTFLCHSKTTHTERRKIWHLVKIFIKQINNTKKKLNSFRTEQIALSHGFMMYSLH
jgi:hypothetical protein